MAHIKNAVNNMSIRKKIIFCTYVILVPLLLVICILLTAYRYSAAQEEDRQRQEGTVGSLASALDILQQEVSYLSLNLMVNQDINRILTSGDVELLNQEPELWTDETAIQMMEEIVYLKSYVKTFSIYPENGIVPYLRCIDLSAYVSELDTLRQTAVYKQACSRKGKAVWIRVGAGESEIYQANRASKLVLCREIYDLSKKRKLGFLTVGISEDRIRGLCEDVLQNTKESVLLLNHAGQIIGRYGASAEEEEQYIQKSDLNNGEEYTGSFKKKRIFLHKIGDSECYVCKIAPQKDFWQVFAEIGYMPVILMAAVLIGLLPVMTFVSRIISTPLENVCMAMQRFQKGDFSQQLDADTKDEVGQVASCFNQMVKDMEQLINKNYIMVLKERESELAVLQAQINPHFLYNALDSIYWQALSADDEAAAESVYELSQLFRMVLGNGKGIVTVAMEAELVQRYLEIQRLRFSHQLEYRIDIAADILGEKIPKLILQPFVENAVIHGMEKENLCVVTVTGKREGSMLEFEIADTGIGMTKEQIQKIWEDANKKYSSQRIGKYAIKNVKERLELKYGGDFRLEIASEEGKGTVVTLAVPSDTEEESHGSEAVDSGR